MRALCIMIGAGAVGGAATYAVLEWRHWIDLSTTDLLQMKIRVFVATLAAVGIGSAAIALAMRGAFARGEARRMAAFESRLARLENGHSGMEPMR